MDLKERIIKTENEFPKLMTNFEERDYGILYFNEQNKESGDSNHAIIYPEKISDLRFVLNDIITFYEKKNIRPYSYLYHPFTEDYFIHHAKILKESGFQFTIYPDIRMMLLTEENRVQSNQLDIRHIDCWNDAVEQDVFMISDNSEYFKNVVKSSMKDNNYLFIGYFENEAVSLLSFHVSIYDCTRFDEMRTAKKHRGKGYAREMNSFAVDFHHKHNLPIAYQWPAHRSSERITTEVGFRVAFTLPAGSATLAEY